MIGTQLIPLFEWIILNKRKNRPCSMAFLSNRGGWGTSDGNGGINLTTVFTDVNEKPERLRSGWTDTTRLEWKYFRPDTDLSILSLCRLRNS